MILKGGRSWTQRVSYIPTRQILDSKGVIPSKTAADAKIAIQEMAEYSQKWHNGTSSRTKSTETSDGLAAIQAQLNNLGRKIKKVNEKVYAAQYKAARPGFYQRNNGNSSYPDRRLSLEESLTKFMAGLAKRHKENSNIIKEIRASTDVAVRNQGASIKTLEIQIGQMSKVLQERGFGSLPSSMKTNPRNQVKSISTVKVDFFEIRRIGHEPYAVSGTQHKSLFSETVPFSRRLQNFGCDDWREAQDVKILDTYDHSLTQNEKDPGSFTLPFFIHNICFDKDFVDLGANFIILDIPEDNDVPLILGRPFLSTAHSKIDVFKRKITLRVGEEKLVFKSVMLATSIIKRVFVIKSLDSKTNFIREGDESFNPIYGGYIELNDLDTPLETKTDQDDFVPIFVKTRCYKMEFSCVIGYKYVITDLLPSLLINLMSKSFYYSIFGDKDEGKSNAGTLINIPVFIGSFSIISGFTIIDDDDMTKDVVLNMKFCKKYASCQRIMKRFTLGNNCERIMEDE
ncbi:hypothetical protein Tco_0519734 [Tanacetum coccineum]